MLPREAQAKRSAGARRGDGAFWTSYALKGTYVSVEPWHLFRYLDEQAFRFNERHDDDAGRFVRAMRDVVGRRLTFAELTGGLSAAPV